MSLYPWVGGNVSRLLRVGAVAPSQALGVGSCKYPKVRPLSTSSKILFEATGEAGCGKELLELRQELRGPGASLQLWAEGLGEPGVMGGFVLVMLEPRTCVCCTGEPYTLSLLMSACMWTSGELEAGAGLKQGALPFAAWQS